MKRAIVILLFYTVIPTFLFGGEYDVQIWEKDCKWIKRGYNYSTYSWKVAIRNNTDTAKKVYVKIELQDNDKFTLDYDNKIIYVKPFDTYRFSETAMIQNHLADQVKYFNYSISWD